MVHLISPSGYCYGVKNSLNKVFSAYNKNKKRKIFFLHPLVHNSSSVLKIKEKTGAKDYSPEEKAETYYDSLLVFPAHGYTSKEKLLAYYLNASILDCTCPFLIAEKNMMKRDLDNGFTVFFLAKEGHQETLSVLDSDSRIKLIKESEAASFDFSAFNKAKKVSLYPQSTLGLKVYEDFKKREEENYHGLLKTAPLCHECVDRWQNALKIDCQLGASFLVIGDPTSSNSNEFINLLKDNFPGRKVFLIDSLKSLKEAERHLDYRFDIYLASATSASDEEVKKYLKQLKRVNLLNKLLLPFRGLRRK
ncbi:MAG: hypothetical protein LKJ88_04780 [Bacilli bacterium]|jgi:4-hydroxy-3-methylbut-2-enyl diphosphate reductase|nr:hypothetical protein [Bacilli bacterium]